MWGLVKSARSFETNKNKKNLLAAQHVCVKFVWISAGFLSGRVQTAVFFSASCIHSQAAQIITSSWSLRHVLINHLESFKDVTVKRDRDSFYKRRWIFQMFNAARKPQTKLFIHKITRLPPERLMQITPMENGCDLPCTFFSVVAQWWMEFVHSWSQEDKINFPHNSYPVKYLYTS